MKSGIWRHNSSLQKQHLCATLDSLGLSKSQAQSHLITVGYGVLMKSAVSRNSTPIARQKILGVISAKHAEKLLLDWVNLQNTPKALNRMRLQHPQVFSFLGQD